MPTSKLTFVMCVLLLCAGANGFSQVQTRTSLLKQAATVQAEKERLLHIKLLKLSEEKGWPMVIVGEKGRIAMLMDVDALGMPIYASTDNLISAATTRTDKLWPGGSSGLNLSGSSNNVKGKLGIWDGGRIRGTHVEFGGRVTTKDVPSSTSDHSTHVAGTLIASGVNPSVKGMAFGMQELIAYDFTNHLSEMLNEASNGMLVSNHSYGAISGWRFNSDQNRWEWWGGPGAMEDYKFGYYSSEAQIFDSIAYNAPYYLIVKSSGNNRSENGPAVGQPYYHMQGGNWVLAGNRPAGISNNDSYDIIPSYGTAKNILTVGAIGPIPGGYSQVTDAVLTNYSSWGPTDDGRIKPDLVANGEDVYSTTASADDSYNFSSGTSMATPNVSGSLILLQEYYAQQHGGSFMRSATLKGIAIHTADEVGANPGPDYQAGWGLLNMEKAAEVITANNTDKIIQEEVLNNSGTFTLPVVASGKGPLTVTLCWTDVKGNVTGGAPLNNTDKRLINDLDIRVKQGGTTYFPWILNPLNRSAAATKGDNVLDNVEKIEIPEAIPGQSYTIEVTHKGTLARSSQAFSVIVSGVGGAAYCTTSAPSSTDGARIDSISFGNIRKMNPAGCTGYTDYTGLTANVEPNSTMPIYISLSQCNGGAANKIVKAWIDFNNDGDFVDAGELVATSPVILGSNFYTGIVTIPAGIKVNNYTLMRVVVQETSSPAAVTPCGVYTRGETQDYRIHVIDPSTDLGITELVSPYAGECSSSEQYVTVRIRNYGSVEKSNIPVSVVVKNGATTILTLNETFMAVVPPYSSVDYTFQTPFVSLPGATYEITSQANFAGDQLMSNNSKVVSVQVPGATTAPAGEAEICGTDKVFLKTATSGSDVFFWYNTPAATDPIAVGSNTSSTVITSDKKYYLAKNDLEPSIGPENKTILGGGSYGRYSGNFVTFNNTVPVLIESARLYIGYVSKGAKLRFTVGRNLNFNNTTGSYSYQPVSTVLLDPFATDPTPQIGGSGDAADNGHVFLLNLPVPTTGAHFINVQLETGDSVYLFRNSPIATNPYPIGIPNVFQIDGNSASYGPGSTPDNYKNYYYFFYDMKLSWSDCGSNRATINATTATAPTITQNGDDLMSSSNTGNRWYLNGNAIAGATAQTYKPIQSGTYKVVVTDAFGCSQSSNEIVMTVTGVPNIDPSEIGLKVLPNPNNGRFGLQFKMDTRSDLHLVLSNALGQQVYQKTYPGFVGIFNNTVDAGRLAPGVYMLRVEHDRKQYLKKIIVR